MTSSKRNYLPKISKYHHLGDQGFKIRAFLLKGEHSIHTERNTEGRDEKGLLSQELVVIALAVFCSCTKLDTQRMVTCMLFKLVYFCSALTWTKNADDSDLLHWHC